MKNQQALESIANQLVKNWEKPDMPPFDWPSVEEHVLKMIKAKYEAEITNRIHTLDLQELTRFMKICVDMQKAGIKPKEVTPPPPAAEVASKKELAAIESIPPSKPATKAASKGKK